MSAALRQLQAAHTKNDRLGDENRALRAGARTRRLLQHCARLEGPSHTSTLVSLSEIMALRSSSSASASQQRRGIANTAPAPAPASAPASARQQPAPAVAPPPAAAVARPAATAAVSPANGQQFTFLITRYVVTTAQPKAYSVSANSDVVGLKCVGPCVAAMIYLRTSGSAKLWQRVCLS